jgi:hypothetical protein
VVKPQARALGLVALLTAAPCASAQTLTIAAVGDSVKVRATGWSFMTGEALARVKEGQTVRVELSLFVLAAPGRSPAAAVRQSFSISYDLWEERFAATTATHAASMSHLTAAAVEAWCLDQLSVPIASLGGVDPQRFWIRLAGRILDGEGASDADEDAGLTLQRLIDVLSRRRKADAPPRALEGGPFHVR